MKGGNAAVRARLQHDLKEIVHLQQVTGELAWLSIEPIHGDQEIWRMTLVGAKGSYWSGQQYDFEIHFTKKFPFEPPSLHFPPTPRNAQSIRHPAVGRHGELFLDSVSRDNWNCSWSVLNIIREVQALFTTDPQSQYTDLASLLLELPETQLLTIASYLPLRSVLDMGQTCKKALLLTHSNNLWAELYYSRCQVPAPILYVTGGALQGAGPGPLREVSQHGGQCGWRHAREAFIRAHQCHQVVRSYGVPRVECLAANELAVLLPLAYPAEHNGALAAVEAEAASAPPNAPQDGSAPMPTPTPHHMPLHLQHAFGGPVGPLHTDQAFLSALRYRCLRAARLARSLGGEECLRANIEHNYWGNLPVTTLIFLASLALVVGPSEARRVWLESRLASSAAQHQHVSHSRLRHRDGMDAEETVPTDHPSGQSGNSGNQGAPQPSAEGPVASLGSQVEAPGLPAGRPCPLVQLKLQLVQQLLDSQEARGALDEAENCDNFECYGSVQKGKENPGAAQGQDTVRPDLYDLLEVLHETNIALSFAFRAKPHTIKLDCLDQNGDWLEATPCQKQPATTPTPATAAAAAAPAVPAAQHIQLPPMPQSLFQLDARPDEPCRRGRAEYIAAMAGRASVMVQPLDRVRADKSTLLAICRLVGPTMSSKSEAGAQWLCMFCLAGNATKWKTCQRCRNETRGRLRLDDLMHPRTAQYNAQALGLDSATSALPDSRTPQPPDPDEHRAIAAQPQAAHVRITCDIAEHLARAVSPFLAFSGAKARTYFRDFCLTLQKEQKAEHDLAASYHLVEGALRGTGTEEPDQAEPLVGLLTALLQRLETARARFPDSSPPPGVMCGSAVPITSPWPTAQSTPTGTNQLSYHYKTDLTNCVIRHQGIHSHAWPADMDSLLTTRVYEPLSFARDLLVFGGVTVHFTGFDSRFDERIEASSARLAPYRTHTTRPATTHTQALSDLLLLAQDQLSGVRTTRHTQGLSSAAHPFDLPAAAACTSDAVSAHRRREEVFRTAYYQEPHPKKTIAIVAPPELRRATVSEIRAVKQQRVECVEFTVRCLWLMSRPGGGVVRYKVPCTTPLAVIVQDYCAVQGISTAEVRAARLDMISCLRYVYTRRMPAVTQSSQAGGVTPVLRGQGRSMPGVCFLETTRTIAELQILQSSVIDLLFYP